MTLVTPGIYTGKILNYNVRSTAKGDPEPQVVFEIHDSAGAPQKVYWRGSFNGGALDKTLEALLTMGLQSLDDLDNIADGAVSGALDLSRELSLTIENEADEKDPSKVYTRVRWVNAVSGAGFKESMKKSDYLQKISGKNIKAEIARIAKARGIALGKKSDVPTPDNSDIPF